MLAFATGFGFSLMAIWWETALARHIPANLLSRVSSYDWMGSLALLPLGYAIAGPLANALGAQRVLLVGSGIGLLMLGAPGAALDARADRPRGGSGAQRARRAQ